LITGSGEQSNIKVLPLLENPSLTLHSAAAHAVTKTDSHIGDVPVALFQSVPVPVPVGTIPADTGTSIFVFNKWPLKPLTKQTGGKKVFQIQMYFKQINKMLSVF